MMNRLSVAPLPSAAPPRTPTTSAAEGSGATLRLLLVAACLLLSTPLFAAKVKNLDKPASDDIIVRPADRTVTLDVKDAEARDIFKSMQKQCGIKNLIVDPQVPKDLKGTFLFTEVPCRTAFPIVLKSLGLASVTYSNALVSVGEKPR